MKAYNVPSRRVDEGKTRRFKHHDKTPHGEWTYSHKLRVQATAFGGSPLPALRAPKPMYSTVNYLVEPTFFRTSSAEWASNRKVAQSEETTISAHKIALNQAIFHFLTLQHLGFPSCRPGLSGSALAGDTCGTSPSLSGEQPPNPSHPEQTDGQSDRRASTGKLELGKR